MAQKRTRSKKKSDDSAVKAFDSEFVGSPDELDIDWGTDNSDSGEKKPRAKRKAKSKTVSHDDVRPTKSRTRTRKVDTAKSDSDTPDNDQSDNESRNSDSEGNDRDRNNSDDPVRIQTTTAVILKVLETPVVETNAVVDADDEAVRTPKVIKMAVATRATRIATAETTTMVAVEIASDTATRLNSMMSN